MFKFNCYYDKIFFYIKYMEVGIRMKEILRGSLVIFVFKIFGAVSLFLTYILIPRYYGVELFGIFNILFGLLLVGTVISRMGLDTYTLRVLSSLNENTQEISLFLKSIFKILLISSLLVSLLILVFLEPINTYLFKSIDAKFYIIGLSLAILPYTFFNVFPEVFRGFDDIKRYSFFRNLAQNLILVILLILGIVFSLNYTPIDILFMTVLILFITISFALFFFLKEKKVNVLMVGKYKKKILKNSYPMFLAASLMLIMSYIDSFMIAYYLDEYQVGIYSACINLSMIITFIPIAIGGFISPKVSKAYSENNIQEVKNIFKNSLVIIVVVTLPIFSVLYIYAESFLSLFGTAFTSATLTLLITNIAFLSEALCGPVGFVMNMTDNQHIFMRILLVSLLINITFNALLIPIYGINGAAIAMLLSMLFWTVGSLIFLKKKEII